MDRGKIIATTLLPPPKKYGVTHGSPRLLAQHLKTSDTTVAKGWREVAVAPWPVETFKFSTDPSWSPKVTDIVGLYLAPPEDPVVLCIDEKSRFQALDLTAPMLPMQPGLPQRRTHDYKRHGTTTLFAALEIATSRLTSRCQPRHRHKGFLRFLKQVAKACPERELHLVMDKYGRPQTGRDPRLACRKPPRARPLTPTSASWMNMVEIWSGIVERQATTAVASARSKISTQRSAPSSTAETTEATPFAWTKPADQVLTKAKRPATINSGH